jgi:hypothetical protein
MLPPHFELQDFRSATTGVAAKTMRNELNNMVNGVTDPSKKKVCFPQYRSISSKRWTERRLMDDLADLIELRHRDAELLLAL